MTTLANELPRMGIHRARVDDSFVARDLITLRGTPVRVPDEERAVHLQMRRYAGCPVCSLHLRTFVKRAGELAQANVREVVVFHSSANELRKAHADLPFDAVPDPERRLYAELGVTTSVWSLLDPRGLFAATHALLRGASRSPIAGSSDGSFGLPADFFIDPSGRIVSLKYGVHADDQWTVDDVLALARGAR